MGYSTRVVATGALATGLVALGLHYLEAPSPGLRLTILHNNDGESQLLHAGAGVEQFGGIGRFIAKLRHLESAAGEHFLVLSSGDNMLPGPEFDASLERGPPLYDSIALKRIGYHAICLGNHDFDFGPDVLATLIEDAGEGAAFLSANLDFSEEPRLRALEASGALTKHTIVELAGGHRIGLIGLTTAELGSISAPRRVKVDKDLVGVVQDQVAELEGAGIDKIILLSHLQDIAFDVKLTSKLSGVDVIIAGGGDELLASVDDRLVPGDEKIIAGSYPTIATDARSRRVPIVTTPGAYRYIGRLILQFDRHGEVVEIDKASGVVRVAGGEEPDAVIADPEVERIVTRPLQEALAKSAAKIVGRSAFPLDGLRGSIRGGETNLGALVADAIRWHAGQLAPDYGLRAPEVGVINGGGIRNDSIIDAGPITELDTFDILPFPSFVSIVPELPLPTLVAVLEHSLSNVGGGSFLHVSGMEVGYSATDGGASVHSLVLDDGRVLVADGRVAEDAKPVNVATISFIAAGGGGAPFPGAFTNLGATYQHALSTYLSSPEGAAGVVSGAQYPKGGCERLKKR